MPQRILVWPYLEKSKQIKAGGNILRGYSSPSTTSTAVDLVVTLSHDEILTNGFLHFNRVGPQRLSAVY